ncbi:hypothetical protein RhiirA4_518001 [Rhizophagus irregularis]|uniref:Uncharacterized protein n=1 Tax=Rhizophagus irregularis TaxID=588596 RepID=A0A2I1GGS1_9GLOM|nr:hypothetical protein RhiirA4_518001 [Rhizophagus irregularis]
MKNLDVKPKWISIISNNGLHYHNSELMIIMSKWYEWYRIHVKKWIFLEAGEAKTTVNSHHAQIQKFAKCEVNQSLPQISESTELKSSWKILIPHASGICLKKLPLQELTNKLQN